MSLNVWAGCQLWRQQHLRFSEAGIYTGIHRENLIRLVLLLFTKWEWYYHYKHEVPWGKIERNFEGKVVQDIFGSVNYLRNSSGVRNPKYSVLINQLHYPVVAPEKIKSNEDPRFKNLRFQPLCVCSPT